MSLMHNFTSFQKKYGLTDLTIHSLEDAEGILNAFEIKGNLFVLNGFHVGRLLPIHSCDTPDQA